MQGWTGITACVKCRASGTEAYHITQYLVTPMEEDDSKAMKNTPTPEEMQTAIYQHCLACSGGSRKELHNCRIKTCKLYPYREPEAKKKPRKIKGQVSFFELMKEAT